MKHEKQELGFSYQSSGNTTCGDDEDDGKDDDDDDDNNDDDDDDDDDDEYDVHCVGCNWETTRQLNIQCNSTGFRTHL
jgi:hypothetical protein